MRIVRRAVGRTTTLAAALLTAALLVSASPSAALAEVTGATPAPLAGSTTTPNVLDVFSPKYMDRNVRGPVSREKALADARNFDVILPHENDYRGHVAAMKAVNPRLRLLAYMDATFVQAKESAGLPGDWFAKDRYGRKIKHSKYDTYLMNNRSAGWIDNRRRRCRELIASVGYDGCLLDDMGAAPVSASRYVSSPPVDPRTGKPISEDDYLAANAALGRAVKESVAPHPVWANGLGGGSRYFKARPPWLQTLDGGMAESWLHGGSDAMGSYPDVAEWKQSVDMMGDAASRGVDLVLLTKAWTNGSQAQKDAWHRFALASFLLGNDGRHRFYFSYGMGQDQSAFHPWWSTSLGAPRGRYYGRPDGTFARDFARGQVVVNPTGRTVRVSTKGLRVLGGGGSGSISLPPHSGALLLTG